MGKLRRQVNKKQKRKEKRNTEAVKHQIPGVPEPLEVPGAAPCAAGTWSRSGKEPCINCKMCVTNLKAYPFGQPYHRPHLTPTVNCGNTSPGSCRQGYTALGYRNRFGGGLYGANICPSPTVETILRKMKAYPDFRNIDGGDNVYNPAKYELDPGYLWDEVYLAILGHPGLQHQFIDAVSSDQPRALNTKKRTRDDSSSSSDDDTEVYCIDTDLLDSKLMFLGNNPDQIDRVIRNLKGTRPEPNESASRNTLIYRLEEISRLFSRSLSKRARLGSPRRRQRKSMIRHRREKSTRRSRKRSIRRSRKRSIRRSRKRSVRRSRKRV